MTRRSIIFVATGLLAVVVGVVIALAATRENDDESGSDAATTSVLVATSDIESGSDADELVASDVVVVRRVSGAQDEGTLTDVAQLVGKTFAADVSEGDAIHLTDLSAPPLRAESIDVPDGTEAVAVSAPFVPAGAGYISAGDRVNVLALVDDAGQGKTVLVLSDTQVLDVDTELAPRTAPVGVTSDAPTTTEVAPTQITYLLAVPTAEVDRVVQAAGFHSLYLTLPADGAPAAARPPVDDAQLLGAGG